MSKAIIVALALLQGALGSNCAIDASVAGGEISVHAEHHLKFMGFTPLVTRHGGSEDKIVVTGASSPYVVTTDADGSIVYEKETCEAAESDVASRASGPSWLSVLAAGTLACGPRVSGKLMGASLLAAGSAAMDSCDDVIEIEIHTSSGGGHDDHGGEDHGPNPCIDPELGYAPLRDDLGNVPCVDADAQSAYDVTEGSVGMMDPALDPVPDYNAAGMCTVNVHWHIGAEHRSEGEYDETFDFDHPGLHTYDGEHRRLAGGELRVGHMCKNAYDMNAASDPLVANEYDWQYCKDMHVGLTYEFHWPHSSLGACQTKWQYQYHFLDGVLCMGTVLGVDIATAASLLLDRTHAIGVEGQVFTIVNSESPDSSPYRHATWDPLNSWNQELAQDRAYYQGSTTGDAVDNEICRGTGGLVTWHQDRECHLLEARTMDNLCRMMMAVSADDMAPDTYPHGARETTTPELSDTPVSSVP